MPYRPRIFGKQARSALPSGIASSVPNKAQLLGRLEGPQETSEISMGVPSGTALAGFDSTEVPEQNGQRETPKLCLLP